LVAPDFVSDVVMLCRIYLISVFNQTLGSNVAQLSF